MLTNGAAKLKNIPHKPGVYLFKNIRGDVIYVGKAVDLRNRLSQYFHKNFDGRPQIPFLMNEAEALEHIVVDNEFESLILENNLIKKYKPTYNIKLRDDKNYAFIKIDFSEEIPQICTIRNPDTKNAKYFGPYSSSVKIRDTLHVLRKIFPYCSNKKVGNRPCFYYYLHRCPGVCIGKMPLDEYRLYFKKIILFLAGNISEIKREIKIQMHTAARQKAYERAAHLRDQLRSLEIIEERQKAIFAQKVNWDFISYFPTADKTTINVFAIRNGRLIDRKNFILEDTQNKPPAEIIGAFMQKYYAETSDLPRQIYTEELPAELPLLHRLFPHKVEICKPSRGKKNDLIRLGKKNAQDFFETWITQQGSEISKTTIALDELTKVLHLPKMPYRIECFDISNIQGTNSVASMVIFENARAKKSEYRKFKISLDGMPNDFAMMREALMRRFKHTETATASVENQWPLPDLLVIDGGKGQLGIAEEVLKHYQLNIPVIGLAKREEEIFVPGKAEAILLPKSNYALQLLQRLRDEAHRFAITFHKKIRSRQSYKSALDEVPGIGPKKKKMLKQKFGSIQRIKEAGQEELAAIVGQKAAKELIQRI